MVSAYILITTEVGSEDEVLETIKRLPSVKSVSIVYGAYDLVAYVEAPSMDEIKRLVSNEIRKIEKIRSTLTMPVIEH
ncbi:AsnC family transcriptional regulator [Candidatus Marsarchaeota G1 archaeon OSP_B]|uniref:AsnC family transcriptional regulator n=6 Tax=Candidatus Marsarchaeota TaxID=1978152 RepID=A0A2R6C1E0_9ARCH|nr:MAG: AsnC family transcriptional regulator [Candidatus Marsarchaeota G1 archaeon OSP_D]PSN84693.1 MAG: AsnC family transcriptional regulator [Candidatus Marsarchaeota G1 archaeon BE_D]PSN87445.1 MAG: AsnC family transcriptional regulator [Candidatus Marsarchaeota G1 archaeon OSP_C]PSN96547.1 MAG: AsnC family transcriptional regulator [Candidatus Marsarchaeota G1 archaeon OSP_B]PSO03662.1 MAG: AsnC family transcriptional regulator [Candidatus Marsarchaeota G2 archaeon ECH_B_SAG-E12]PSO04691.